MRESEGAREALLRLLDDRVFRPALGKGRGEYISERQQDDLDLLKNEVRRQRDLFHDPLHSAATIRAQFLEMAGNEARTAELDRRLGLPHLASIRGEFLMLCEELGVRSEVNAEGPPTASPNAGTAR